MRKRWQKIVIYIPLILLGIFLFGNFVCAAPVETGLNYATATGLGTQDIRVTVANIIKVFLGLLGFVAIGLIMYGGFIYMTASGVAEKIDKAKKILIGAVIGLAIVLSAYAITTYILNKILEATGAGTVVENGSGTSTSPSSSILPGYCADPDSTSSAPYICQLSPATGKKGAFVTITGGKFGAYDANNSKVVFSQNDVDYSATIASCNNNPSWETGQIVVEVPNLPSNGDYDVNVINSNGNSNTKPTGSLTPNNRFTLISGEPGPGIACIVPSEGKEGTAVEIYGKRFGAAMGTVKFPADVSAVINNNDWADEKISSKVPVGAVTGAVFVYNSSSVKSDNGYYFNVSCGASSDCSATKCCFGNVCRESSVCAASVGQTCSDKPACSDSGCQNGLYCDVASCTCQASGLGSSCTASASACVIDNSKCSQGLYCASDCSCQALPEITKIDPDNGASGNLVTIFGKGFGGQAERAISDSSLIGWWKFNEGSGTAVSDASGKTGSGTLESSLTWVDSKFGKGLQFARQGQVKLPAIDLNNKSFSIITWVKKSQVSGITGLGNSCSSSATTCAVDSTKCGNNLYCADDCTCQYTLDLGILSQGTVTAKDQYMEVIVRQGKPMFGFYSDDLYGKTILENDKWYMITAVYDNAAKKKYIYLNGLEDASQTNSGAYAGDSSNTLIGTYLGYGHFNGIIDDVQIYNRALSSDEVKKLYGIGKIVFSDNKEASVASGCEYTEWWQDNQVVVEVPSGASSGKIKLTTADGLSVTSPSDFTANDTVRPGLCAINQSQGQFGDYLILSGKKFGASKGSALIGGVEFNNKTNWSWANTLIKGLTIPNLSAATLPIQVKVGGEYSNTLNFTVVAAANAPKIDYLNPTAGAPGKYITIFGSNFGAEAGQVLFQNGESSKSNWAVGGTDFPQACLAAGYWHNTSITVKVPAGALAGGKIIVQTKAGAQSNEADFNNCSGLSNCSSGPNVCAIVPSQAPLGTKDITIYGDNFGAEAGSVSFWNNIDAGSLSNSWTNTQIGTGNSGAGGSIVVPSAATSGNVYVISKTNLLKSNPILFTVSDCRNQASTYCSGLGADLICCQQDGICKTSSQCSGQSATKCSYGWSFKTGALPAGPPQVIEDISCDNDIQSPTPWKDSSGNCNNAEIAVRFNQSMDFTDFASGFKIEDCTDTKTFAFDKTKCQEVSGEKLIAKGSYYFIYDPATLSAGHWYLVTLLSQYFKSVAGQALDGDFDDQSGGDYVWKFKVDTNDVACQPSKVVVSPGDPNPITLTKTGQTQSYLGSALAANCNMLNANDYPWRWSTIDIEHPFDAKIPIVNLLSAEAPFKKIASANDQGKVNIKSEIYPDNATKNLFDANKELDVNLGKPQINKIYPLDGIVKKEALTNVTIYGLNFGAAQNDTKVFFGTVEAELADCKNNWSDTMIMVKTPLSALENNGDQADIKVVTTAKGSSNTKTFKRNDSKIYPFLCSLDPVYGQKNDAIIASGDNFGDSNKNLLNGKNYNLQSNIIYAFSEIVSENKTVLSDAVTNWANKNISYLNPDGNEDKNEAEVSVQISPDSTPFMDTAKIGYYDLTANPAEDYYGKDSGQSYTYGDVYKSNTLPFDFTPVITSVTPDNGPDKQWITITGLNFGTVAGQICFNDSCGAYFPPSPCKNYWTNRQIIARVPDNAPTGNYNLTIKTSKNIQSNAVNFEVNENALGPGICEITPVAGYVGSSSTIKGEGFEDTRGESNVVYSSNLNASAYTVWSGRNIIATIPSKAASGSVSVSKKVQTGQACVGFSIGSYCFSGQYSPVYKIVNSNPYYIQILTSTSTSTTSSATQCKTDADCRGDSVSCQSKCVDGQCTPFITGFTPTQGPLGTWTTISGCHFGCSKGEVYFTGKGKSIFKNGELAFYNFEGNTSDISGNNNTAFAQNCQNGEADNTILNSDGYVQLNGTNQCVITQYNDTLNYFSSNSSGSVDGISAAAWINTSTGGTIVSQGGNQYYGRTGHLGYTYWYFYVTADKRLHIEAGGYPVASLYAETAANSVPSNNWTHVAAVIWNDAYTNSTYIKAYVNGSEVALETSKFQTYYAYNSSANKFSLPTDRYRPLVIGARSFNEPIHRCVSNKCVDYCGYYQYPYTCRQLCANCSCNSDSDCLAGNADFFKGKIDDVRIYNSPLSSADIRKIYDSGNSSSGFGYNVLGKEPSNASCTYWNCSSNGLNDQVIAEAPDKNNLTSAYNAQTGPLEIITSNKLSDNTEHLSESDFTVNTDALPPNICKIEPQYGARGAVVKVYGENLADSDYVNFSPKTDSDYLSEPYLDSDKNNTYTSYEEYIDINNNNKYDSAADYSLKKSDYESKISSFTAKTLDSRCPANGSDDQSLCFSVPANAAGAGVSDLSALNSVSVTKNSVKGNDLNYSVIFPSGSTAAALEITQTIPYKNSQNFCRNGIIDIYFDSYVNPSTITKDNFQIKCATSQAKNDNSVLAFVKNFFIKLTGINSLALAGTKCPIGDSYSLDYHNLDGKTVVSLIPDDLLAAGQNYEVDIIGGLSGVMSITGAQLDTTSSGNSGIYVLNFKTAGDSTLGDTESNGICKISDIAVYVSSTSDLKSEDVRNNYDDLFTCAGNSCKSDVDYDQNSSSAGNQHTYRAEAYFSGGVRLKATYTWVKSDLLDPSRALSFSALDSAAVNADTNSDEYKFTNVSGKVYVTDAAIKKATAKLVIQAQAQGITSNIAQHDFTVYLLLCQNPWPSLNKRTFPDEQINAYNFGTWYCRDSSDSSGELPSANIITN